MAFDVIFTKCEKDKGVFVCVCVCVCEMDQDMYQLRAVVSKGMKLQMS
jgi:hypothetical protein